MQRLEFSGVVRPIYVSLGVKRSTTRVYAYSHTVIDHLCRLCNLYFMEFYNNLQQCVSVMDLTILVLYMYLLLVPVDVRSKA